LTVRVSLWVKAGSRSDGVIWDSWRKRWVVSCRAPPAGGQANRAVARLVAEWLELSLDSVRWEKAGASRAKILRVEGIAEDEVERRLRSRADQEHPGAG